MESTTINLLPLEQKFPDFRSDELYFIRLAGVYLQSIFWDVFSNSSKAGKKRLAGMLELACNKITNPHHQHFRDAILNPQKRHTETMDCLSGAFYSFLESFPTGTPISNSGDEPPASLRTVFVARLKEHHAIFLSFDEFLHTIQRPLNRKRNFLEHYDDSKQQKKSNPDDEAFIRALGLLLPPQFLHLFSGRMTHYRRKLKCPEDRKKMEAIQSRIENIFVQCKRERRERTKKLFAEELTRKEIKDKNKRKALVSPGQEYREAYASVNNRYKNDYRLWEFKTRYYFIGRQNFHAIKHLLGGGDETAPLSFKRDIEALYLLTCNVNLHLHRFIQTIPPNERTEELRDVRNAIAHNDMFWRVKGKTGHEYSVEEVFRVVMDTVREKYGKEKANDFWSGLERLFSKERYAIVDKRDDHERQPWHVREWTVQAREEYAREIEGQKIYERDMRRRYKAVVGKWRRDLQFARRKPTIAKIEQSEEKCSETFG